MVSRTPAKGSAEDEQDQTRNVPDRSLLLYAIPLSLGRRSAPHLLFLNLFQQTPHLVTAKKIRR